MSVPPLDSQGIRSINIDNPTATPPTPAEIVYVDVYTDRNTKDKFILWDEIRLAFYSALHVRHKARIVPFIKDSDFNTVKPLRIAVIPGEVLDIVIGNPRDTTVSQQQHLQQQHHYYQQTPKQQPSKLKQIEQLAARLPRHNPLSTLRPIPSTHSWSSVQDARSNNCRQKVDDVAVEARNKKLAYKYAKEAITKLVAKVDLDALHANGDGAPGDFRKALECYLRAVNQSHAHAQVQVGDLFLEGAQGVSKDSSVAMGWYMKAAFYGDTNAQRKLEILRISELRPPAAHNAYTSSIPEHQGHNNNPTDNQPPNTTNDLQIAKDPIARTVVDFDQAWRRADRGDKDAQVVLGDMYKDGKEVSQDYQAAMDWYLKAAEQGDPVGQRKVGYLYDLGLGVPQDYAQAVTWYLKAANQGDAQSQFNIGSIHDAGQGVPQDYAQALAWWLKAAAQGVADAQCCIGHIYYSGQGVAQNYTQAMDWYLKAANQEHADAKYSIGLLYHYGLGVSQDYVQAMTWYLKAANQGHVNSLHNIGLFYHHGLGVDQDYKQALDWYLEAVMQEDVDSQHNIGVLFRDGLGVSQDYGQAMTWFLRAADQGHSLSQHNIGVMYESGFKLPQNQSKAKE